MKVCIVSYEDVNAWILGKFARKLHEELTNIGVECYIKNSPDPSADVNHHIIYLNYIPEKNNSKHTLMITHINDLPKLNMVKDQLKVADAGICMSRDTMQTLVNLGVTADRLCYVDPAHDEVMKPRPYNIGITSKVQLDGCKREGMLKELIHHIDPAYFRFTIMGAGWEPIISEMNRKGIACNYHPDFHYATYLEILPNFDYYLYMGQDEGSMGFIDALAAGVPTITTPQGYHLDVDNGITHPFNTQEELNEIFKNLHQNKKRLVDSVSGWNWKNYAIKHLQLWQYLHEGKIAANPADHDGLNSLLEKKRISQDFNAALYKAKLFAGYFERKYNKARKIKDFSTFREKILNHLKRMFI
jgi:hypothetical protein